MASDDQPRRRPSPNAAFPAPSSSAASRPPAASCRHGLAAAFGLAVIAGLFFSRSTGAAAADAPGNAVPPETHVVFETRHLRYLVGNDGRNRSFLDRATGVDHLRSPGSPCAAVRQGDTEFPVTAVRRIDDTHVALTFDPPGIRVVLVAEGRPAYLRFQVESVNGPAPDAIRFLDIPLDLAGSPSEPFAACTLALTLHTRVDALPALQSHLQASSERRFGLVGAQAALVGRPMKEHLAGLRETLAEASSLPVCTVAGPWADPAPFSHGSYLFNFGTLTETNVAEWIEQVRSLGFNQVDHHGGGEFFRFGDLEPNRARWPDGWETGKRLVDRLHEAGVGSILHTYAFFIDKRSRYVTPVPDPRLDAFRTFTLAADLDASATEIPVEESTAGLSTVTGFFEFNSVLLQLGEELVTFSGFTREAPWRFTGVQRGALGTRAARHPRATPARHLKECFGLLVPNPESTLFEEIAARHAEVINRCGFDGVYLDAIDGSGILRGPDQAWYWAGKFVVDLQRHLQRPVGMEMSAMWHSFWQYRTRWQAWDYPQRGHRRFLDLHAASVHGGLMLPLHLGWWNFHTFEPPQIEPTFPEVMETVGARLVGWDAGLSLTGAVDRKRLQSTPLFRRAVEILRTCEDLRHRRSVPEATRARLREPGAEFRLQAASQPGEPARFRFQELTRHVHTLTPAQPDSLTWTFTNPHPAQPLRFRIEALMSTPPTGTQPTIPLLDPAATNLADWRPTHAQGVEFRFRPADSPFPGLPALELTATNAGTIPRRGAWARMQTTFPTPLNLKNHPALGFWIEGDGHGALLAIRLESPRHLAFGAVADRYLPIDFTGPRWISLVETESERWSDYDWGDGKSLYNVYREAIDFAAVDSVSVWLQNLPPSRTTTCRIGPLQALPMVPSTAALSTITLNDQAIPIDTSLMSGQWLEVEGMETAVLHGSKGELVHSLKLPAPGPQVRPGVNRLAIPLRPQEGALPRLRITVFTLGKLLP